MMRQLLISLMLVVFVCVAPAQDISGGGGGGGGAVAADIITGLVHHYPFEAAGSGDATSVVDAGSALENLTCTNTPQWSSTSCAVGSNCIDFTSASSEYCETTTSPTLPTGDWFTYAFWARIDASDSNVFMIADNATGNELQFYVDGSLYADTQFNNSNDIIADIGATLIASQWYHFALVRSDTLLSIYVNGKPFYARLVTGIVLDFSTCQLLIGTDADTDCKGTLGNYLDGQLDDFRIYSRSLSETDLAALVALRN